MKERDRDILTANIQIRHREIAVKYLQDNKRKGNLLLSLIGGEDASNRVGQENATDQRGQATEIRPDPAAASDPAFQLGVADQPQYSNEELGLEEGEINPYDPYYGTLTLTPGSNLVPYTQRMADMMKLNLTIPGFGADERLLTPYRGIGGMSKTQPTVPRQEHYKSPISNILGASKQWFSGYGGGNYYRYARRGAGGGTGRTSGYGAGSRGLVNWRIL